MLRTLIQQSVDAFLQQSGGGIQIRPAATGWGWNGVADAQLNRHKARPAAPAAQGAVAICNSHRALGSGRSWPRLVPIQLRIGDPIPAPALSLIHI